MHHHTSSQLHYKVSSSILRIHINYTEHNAYKGACPLGDMQFFFTLVSNIQPLFLNISGPRIPNMQKLLQKIHEKVQFGTFEVFYQKLLKNNFKLIITPPNGGAKII